MKRKERKFGPEYFGPIAHRGLHNASLTENGLKAFENAIKNDLPFELDIHVTKDNQLIVCHDDDLKRTTGKEGVIEELTLAEIKEGYRLLDGEEVPTFQEVLDLNKEQKLIVVELKVHQNNYKPLAKAAKKALKQIKDRNKIVVISFDPRALFLMKSSGFPTGLLICKEYYWVWKWKWLFDSVDIEECLLTKPEVRKYHKKHILNTWTVEDSEHMKENKALTDAQTFQLIEPELVKEIMAK